MTRALDDLEPTVNFRLSRRPTSEEEETRPYAWWQRLDTELSSTQPEANRPEVTLTIERDLRRAPRRWLWIAAVGAAFMLAFFGTFVSSRLTAAASVPPPARAPREVPPVDPPPLDEPPPPAAPAIPVATGACPETDPGPRASERSVRRLARRRRRRRAPLEPTEDPFDDARAELLSEPGF